MAGNHDSTESSSSEQSNQHDSNFNDGDEEDKYEEEYCDTDDDDDDIDSYQKYKSEDKEDSDSEEQDFQEGCTRNEQQHASSTIFLITLMKEIIDVMQIPIRLNNMANPLQSITNHLRMEADIVEITTNAHNTEILQTENPINRMWILPMVKIKIQEERTIWGIILMKRNNVHLMLANRKQLHWKQRMLQRMMFQDSVHCLDELLIETLLWTRTTLFA